MIDEDFESDPSGWDLYPHETGSEDPTWDIYDETNGCLELVQDGTKKAMGRAWVDHKMPSGSFDVEFDWQQTTTTDPYNLDGFTFGWVEDATDPPPDPLGGVGGALGAYDPQYEDRAGHTGYFVEIDYCDNGTDYSDDGSTPHVALMQSGPDLADATHIGTRHSFRSDEFQDAGDGDWYRMRVQGEAMSGGSRDINVWLDTDGDGEADDEQYSWTVSNYADVFTGQEDPDSYSYGFTSGTGTLAGSVRIDNVQLSAVPEPASALLAAAAACAGGLAAFRRKRRS